MIQPRFALALAASLPLVACKGDPAKGKPAAEVASATAPATIAADDAREIVPFEANPSKIEFVGSKITGSHTIHIEKFTGKIALASKVEDSAVTLDADASTITTDSAKLTNHLRSPDFFDAAKFPKVTFASTSIRPAGDAYTVTGNLTMHGVTKSVSFPAKIAVAAEGVQADAQFSVNRKDFGLVYPGAPDDLIRDDVAVTLAVRAARRR